IIYVGIGQKDESLFRLRMVFSADKNRVTAFMRQGCDSAFIGGFFFLLRVYNKTLPWTYICPTIYNMRAYFQLNRIPFLNPLKPLTPLKAMIGIMSGDNKIEIALPSVIATTINSGG